MKKKNSICNKGNENENVNENILNFNSNEPIQFLDINAKNIFDYDITKLDIRKVNNHIRLNDICKLYNYLNKNSLYYVSEKNPSISDIICLENFCLENSIDYKINLDNNKKCKLNNQVDFCKNNQQINNDIRDNEQQIISDVNCDKNESCKNDIYTDDTNIDKNNLIDKKNNMKNSFNSSSDLHSLSYSSSSISSSDSCSSYLSSSSSSSSNISDKSNQNNNMNNLKNLEIIKKNIENKEKIKKKKKKFKSILGKFRKYDVISIKRCNKQTCISQIYKFVKNDDNTNIICQWIYSYSDCNKYLYNNFESHLNKWSVLPCLGYFDKNSIESIINKIEVYNFYEFLYLFNDFPLCCEHKKKLKIDNFQKNLKHNIVYDSINNAPLLNYKDEANKKELENLNEDEKELKDINEYNNSANSRNNYKCNDINVKSEEKDLDEGKIISDKEIENKQNDNNNNNNNISDNATNTNNNNMCIYDEEIVLNEINEGHKRRKKENCSFRIFYYEHFLCKNTKIVPCVKKNCVIINRKNNEDLNFFINTNLYDKIKDKNNIYYQESNDYVLSYKNFEFLYFYCFNCRIYYDINIIFSHIIFNSLNSSTSSNKMYMFLQRYKKMYDIKIKRQKVKQTDIYFICSNCVNNNIFNVNEYMEYFYYFCDLVNLFNHNFSLYNEYIKSIFNLDIPFFSLYNVTKEKVLLAIKKKKPRLNENLKNYSFAKKKKNNYSSISSKRKKSQEKLINSNNNSNTLSNESSLFFSNEIQKDKKEEKNNNDNNSLFINETKQDAKKMRYKKEKEKICGHSVNEKINKNKEIKKYNSKDDNKRCTENNEEKCKKENYEEKNYNSTQITSDNEKTNKKNIINEIELKKNIEYIENNNTELLNNKIKKEDEYFDKNLGKRDNKRIKEKKRKKKNEEDELFNECCISNESEEYSFNESMKDYTDEDIIEENQILNEEIYSDDSVFYDDEYTSNRKKRRKKKKGKSKKKENIKMKKLSVKEKNITEENSNNICEKLNNEKKEEYQTYEDEIEEKEGDCNEEEEGNITKYTKVIDKIKQCLDEENMNVNTKTLSKNIVEKVIQIYKNKLDVKMKLFSICSNLLRKDNSELRKKILNGTISCSDLAQMNSSDLAPISLQNKRKEYERKYFYENIYLRENYINLKKKNINDEEETYLPNMIYEEKLKSNEKNLSNENDINNENKGDKNSLIIKNDLVKNDENVNCDNNQNSDDYIKKKSTVENEDENNSAYTIPPIEKYDFEHTYKNLKSIYENLPKFASSPILTFLDNSYNRILSIIDANKNNEI
ncbi:conserved Plasmodium protein, unknown function [Plasmodium relictum]|uniref:TFIIS central domain-containing protein n=1 Tax=Plasmodium relictum TaxID=85471 RepID=A0A1J1H5D8_PLARL|nr:conserved Plasmodium protein, unknown function [Plasmodium relictum]CRH00148.1 conserved Plasmodium protein, unknown function [Plasmodium relictum]